MKRQPRHLFIIDPIDHFGLALFRFRSTVYNGAVTEWLCGRARWQERGSAVPFGKRCYLRRESLALLNTWDTWEEDGSDVYTPVVECGK